MTEKNSTISTEHGEYPEVSTMSFKEASTELERIVRALEAGDLELEETLARYTRGIELLSDLRARLTHAKQQVEVLTAGVLTNENTPDTVSAPKTAYLDE